MLQKYVYTYTFVFTELDEIKRASQSYSHVNGGMKNSECRNILFMLYIFLGVTQDL